MTPLPDDVHALFAGPNYAHLATVLPSGAPHSVPVWTGIEGEHVVFFTQPFSSSFREAEMPRLRSSAVSAFQRRRTVMEPGSAASAARAGRRVIRRT